MEQRDKGRSIVEDYGVYSSTCGYCKSNARTSIAYGLRAHSLSVYDYQDLIDRGWRRSGVFLYKPEMEKTCCPAYTIRLKAESFQISKEQCRVLHRMQRFLDGIYNGPGKENVEGNEMHELDVHKMCKDQISDETKIEVKRELGKIDSDAEKLSAAVMITMESIFKSNKYLMDVEFPEIVIHEVGPNMRKRIKSVAENVAYTCNIAFPVAAALLKKNAFDVITKALLLGNQDMKIGRTDKNTLPILLAERFASSLSHCVQMEGFEVEACKGHLNFICRVRVTSDCGELSDGFECSTSTSTNTLARKKSPLFQVPSSMKPKHVLEIRMRRSAFDPEEFALYKRYQISVHHDKPEDVNESSYIRFLVNTPLRFVPPETGDGFSGFGSFHQQYLIDGRLVAVGVVDVLPNCLSSKYMFWDPDLSFLSIGKYSALREIEWVKQAHKLCPTLEYYYLGYYIHTCPKMRYKAAYRPSELLCPVKLQWVPFDVAQPHLDKQPFVCLSDFLDKSVVDKQRTLNSSKEEPCKPNDNAMKHHKGITEAMQKSEATTSSREDISNVTLKLGDRYLQFMHLQTLTAVPQRYIDALVINLQKYTDAVGSTLATKMAYLLA